MVIDGYTVKEIRTEQELCAALMTDGPAAIKLPHGGVGLLQSVLREDGSGRSFVVTMKPLVGDAGPVKFYECVLERAASL